MSSLDILQSGESSLDDIIVEVTATTEGSVTVTMEVTRESDSHW